MNTSLTSSPSPLRADGAAHQGLPSRGDWERVISTNWNEADGQKKAILGEQVSSTEFRPRGVILLLSRTSSSSSSSAKPLCPPFHFQTADRCVRIMLLYMICYCFVAWVYLIQPARGSWQRGWAETSAEARRIPLGFISMQYYLLHLALSALEQYPPERLGYNRGSAARSYIYTLRSEFRDDRRPKRGWDSHGKTLLCV